MFLEPVALPSFRSKELFDSIRALLQGTIGPGDQVAIATWANAMRVRQNFTDDIPTLMPAVVAASE